MKKRLTILFLLLLLNIGLFSNHPSTNSIGTPNSIGEEEMYANWSQQFHINLEAIKLGIKGYKKLIALGQINNSKYLTIVDFSKPSNAERLFIIDMLSQQVILKTLVAHGKNSGTLMANAFSNKMSSLKSSLGFYLTGNTYQGKHGTSLVLDGVEQGINDQAKSRAIVLHGADYVSNRFSGDDKNPIGRSFGCPAVPNNQVKSIISIIKGGTCLFVYAPNLEYTQKSMLAK